MKGKKKGSDLLGNERRKKVGYGWPSLLDHAFDLRPNQIITY